MAKKGAATQRRPSVPACFSTASEPDWTLLERQFAELPIEARRLTGPLFWLHGDWGHRSPPGTPITTALHQPPLAFRPLNGRPAGGVIGKSFRVNVGEHLKAGVNVIEIVPVAPKQARLVFYGSP